MRVNTVRFVVCQIRRYSAGFGVVAMIEPDLLSAVGPSLLDLVCYSGLLLELYF